MTAVAVCGFGRCGSTMLMAMLDAGGIPIVAGADERSYETPLDRLTADDVDGRAVKALDLYDQLPDHPYRVVWLDRRLFDQVASEIKLAAAAGGKIAPDFEASLTAHHKRQRPRAIRRLAGLGPIHTVRYERALRKPRVVAGELADFLADCHLPPLDVDAAAAVVHDRSPDVRPTLDFELTGRVTSG